MSYGRKAIPNEKEQMKKNKFEVNMAGVRSILVVPTVHSHHAFAE
jgi:hypothetical protein